jgi:hypothetical protein
MNRFNGLSIVCAILSVIGWATVGIGLMAALIIFPKSGLTAVYIACVSIGSGLFAIVFAGAVEVLICIYCNTLPAEVQSTPELH